MFQEKDYVDKADSEKETGVTIDSKVKFEKTHDRKDHQSKYLKMWIKTCL